MDAKVLGFQTNEALSIVQIATDNRDTFNYITGDAAIEKKLIEVIEVSEGGSVNNLTVINHSKDFIFMMDGDILVGAKQNRVLNTSVLLNPESKTIIPVSCIESGRWRYKSRGFSGSDYSAPAFMRAEKAQQVKNNLEAKGKFESNQSGIWDSVAAYERRTNFISDTSNLSDIFDNKKSDFDAFIKDIKPEKEANGISVFVKEKLLSLDLFNRSDVYGRYFPKILRGAAMEVFSMGPAEKKIDKAEASFKTLDFLDKFGTLDFSLHKAVAAGEEKRFETEELTGFELAYNGNMIHLTALNLKRM
jgi:hypothetical protein